MTFDKEGLAAAARALYALEHSCQAPEDMSPPYSPKSKIGLAIAGAETAITAYLAALPNTGDELVARLRTAVDIGTKTGARGQHPTNIYNLANEAAAAITSLTSRAQAAEASLASARDMHSWPTEALFQYGDWVEKFTGEARWKGRIVSAYYTKRLALRYVVEVEPQGFQMIAVPTQLRALKEVR